MFVSSTYSVSDVDRVMDGLTRYHPEWSSISFDRDPDDDDFPAWELFHSPCTAVTELGTITHAASYGGEGQGDDYWVVVKITSPDGSERYFRRDGWYASHCGSELDGETYEVRPRERMVTIYE